MFKTDFSNHLEEQYRDRGYYKVVFFKQYTEKTRMNPCKTYFQITYCMLSGKI